MPPPQGSLELTPLPVPHEFLLCGIPISYSQRVKNCRAGANQAETIIWQVAAGRRRFSAPIRNRAQILQSVRDTAQAEFQVGREVLYFLAMPFQARG